MRRQQRAEILGSGLAEQDDLCKTMTEYEDVALRLDNQLCFSVYSLSNKIGRLYRSLLEQHGLTFPQYLAMLVLWEKAPCTVNEIGRALDLESNTLTPVLKRLEALGFLVRLRDTRDERRVLVHLTAQGRAFRQDALEIRQQLACRTGLTESSAAGLKKSLGSLTELVDAASRND